MKVTPKYQKGGSFDAFFTTYTPIQTESPRQISESQRSSGNSQSTEKGKLTEKDFFDMIKDIDGLPNEMSNIVSDLMGTFQLSNLTGIDTGDLATTYLQNLYQIKIAAQNKKRYDDVLANASKNGALAEPAISMDGKLIVQNDDGSIGTVSLETYNSDRDKYQDRLLTVSNLANMRRYDPRLVNNQYIFDVIDNSMGYEAFQELLSKATQSIGSSETTGNSMFSVEGKASKGLALLQSLREDDRLRAYGSVTAEGLYEYKIIDKDQLNQINALTSYLAAVLPDRAKTWAAFKTEQSNKNQATKDLVFQLLLGRSQDSHQFDIQYKGGMGKVQGTSQSGSSQEDAKEGFWRQFQAGRGGDDSTFNMLNNRTLLSVDGKYYGTTPGLDRNKSLDDYITDSNVGYIIKNRKNITFGDVQISSDNYKDIVVDANSGAMSVTLPITPDGKVDYSVLDVYSDIQSELRDMGLTPNSIEYNKQLAHLLENKGLSYLVDAQNGTIDTNKFGHFLVLKGITSSKSQAVKDNKKIGIDDTESQYIIDQSQDEQLYDIVRQALSSKERGEYKIDPNNWYDYNGWDRLYSANIFIPINMNALNGMNADQNDIKASTAQQYEYNMQQRQKRDNQRPTGSNEL